MSEDLKIQNAIAQVLIQKAPPGSLEIIMKATLLGDRDACKLQFSAINSEGDKSNFFGGGEGNDKIHQYLLKHRDFLVSQGQSKWKACELIVHKGKRKTSMTLKYE